MPDPIISMREEPLSKSGMGYLFAVAVTAVAALLRWVVDPILDDSSQYLLFYFTVMLVASKAGTKSGLLAVVLGAVEGTWFFIYQGHVGERWLDDSMRLGFFLLFGGLATVAAGRLRDARNQAVARARQLVASVTSLEKSEERLRQAKEEWERTFDSVPDMIAILDRQYRILRVNRAMASRLGRSADDCIGRHCHELMHGTPGPPEYCPHSRTMIDNQEHSAEVYETCLGGGFLIRTTPLHDAAGEVIGAVQVANDITERMRAAEQLESAKLAAEAANVAKSQFLANMSHELRTPMNSILGMTEQALEEDLSPDARDCLETVRSSASALHALLNDLLDLSRIEMGQLALEATPFRLRERLDETLQAYRGWAEEKGLRLECDIPADAPDELLGDPLRLRQVLTNLVSNAIKFTERGSVRVRIAAERGRPGEILVRMDVADTGIGIAAEHVARVFLPFTQADGSMTRRFGGTGLGLAITSDLVKRMGGRISVESQLGQGSTFHCTLPFAVAAQPLPLPCRRQGPASGLPRPDRSLRILLAEDTPANQKLIVRILQKRGHQVDVVANGLEAVDLVIQHDYDVVLMDVQMPVMDGFQATAAIRMLNSAAKARLPIAALTAHAMKGDRDRCLHAGMDEYISKPVDAGDLIRLVERLGSGAAATEFPSETTGDEVGAVN